MPNPERTPTALAAEHTPTPAPAALAADHIGRDLALRVWEAARLSGGPQHVLGAVASRPDRAEILEAAIVTLIGAMRFVTTSPTLDAVFRQRVGRLATTHLQREVDR